MDRYHERVGGLRGRDHPRVSGGAQFTSQARIHQPGTREGLLKQLLARTPAQPWNPVGWLRQCKPSKSCIVFLPPFDGLALWNNTSSALELEARGDVVAFDTTRKTVSDEPCFMLRERTLRLRGRIQPALCSSGTYVHDSERGGARGPGSGGVEDSLSRSAGAPVRQAGAVSRRADRKSAGTDTGPVASAPGSRGLWSCVYQPRSRRWARRPGGACDWPRSASGLSLVAHASAGEAITRPRHASRPRPPAGHATVRSTPSACVPCPAGARWPALKPAG